MLSEMPYKQAWAYVGPWRTRQVSGNFTACVPIGNRCAFAKAFAEWPTDSV
jgi:hypothetical protein